MVCACMDSLGPIFSSRDYIIVALVNCATTFSLYLRKTPLVRPCPTLFPNKLSAVWTTGFCTTRADFYGDKSVPEGLVHIAEYPS